MPQIQWSQQLQCDGAELLSACRSQHLSVVLYRIAKHAAARQGAEAEDSLARCYEGLGVIIRRAHGQAVLRRTQEASEDVVVGPRDSAAVVAGASFEDSMSAMQPE